MQKISVLLTNNSLGVRAGTETYVRDVALALIRRGCHPVAFSQVLGEVADELRKATVPVIDNLAQLGAPPDVIHGHHHLETLIAALTFPETPVVHFCHGWLPWEEKPLRHPSIRTYVAVDEVCFDRLVREEGIGPERVALLLNFVDLERFRPRGPLPRRPARALVFSNGATPHGYVEVIRAACDAQRVSLDVAGLRYGTPSPAPEALLRDYDIVFAKARSALEALAVGCAVVLADAAGCGPLVTPENFDRLRARNFGIRELQHAHEPAWYERQIAAYCPEAAAAVGARARNEGGLEPAVDRLLTLYADAVASPPGRDDPLRAAAGHLYVVGRALKQSLLRLETLSHDVEVEQAERESLQGELAAAQALYRAVSRQVEESNLRLEESGRRVQELEKEVNAYRALPTMRVRNSVLRIPVVGKVLQSSVRRLTARRTP